MPPRPSTWPCASIRPGSTVWPCKSRCFALGALAATCAALPTAMMRKAGLSKESVLGQPGEIVTVVANPAWDGTKRLGWVLKITYADGRNYQLGGSPNGQ